MEHRYSSTYSFSLVRFIGAPSKTVSCRHETAVADPRWRRWRIRWGVLLAASIVTLLATAPSQAQVVELVFEGPERLSVAPLDGGEEIGYQVKPAGDVNGDGFEDFILERIDFVQGRARRFHPDEGG